MSAIVKILYWFNMILVWLAKISLLVMVCIVTVVVFLRYVLNTGLSWGEEIPLLLVIWFTMISMAIGVKLKLHINMDVLPDTLSPLTKLILRKISDLAILFVGVIMAYYGYNLCLRTSRSILPGSGIGTYWLYMPLVLSGIMIVFDAVLDLFGVDKRDKEFAARAEGLPYTPEEGQ